MLPVDPRGLTSVQTDGDQRPFPATIAGLWKWVQDYQRHFPKYTFLAANCQALSFSLLRCGVQRDAEGVSIAGGAANAAVPNCLRSIPVFNRELLLKCQIDPRHDGSQLCPSTDMS